MPDDPTKHPDIPGLEFYDVASRRTMKYVYPDTPHPTNADMPHWAAGWILYKHPDGQWVTLRKATDEDISGLNAAVVAAHHGGNH